MKDYEVHITMRPGATRRYTHELVDGKRAGIMDATPGQRGWIWYHDPDDASIPFHRVHTSVVESVKDVGKDIVVTTMNTIYRFTPCNESVAV
jgi:hypothetical protein